MGEVYRAKDARLGRDVAIKVLPALFAEDVERLARFTREAQTLASLNHPNIAAIYGLEEGPAAFDEAQGREAGRHGSGERVRALVMELVTLFAVLSAAASGQVLGVLHIKVTLADAARASMPIPRHALLISDNPATISPRRVVTAPDGTADVRLPPGSYTVESDEPVAFDGKGYQWTQTVEITAGRDVVLELTGENAEVGAAPAPSSSPTPKEDDPSLLLPQWKDSLVSVWTPASRASGFVVDTAGLVVTSQRVIGNASAVDVQLTPSVKVAARVLVADRVRDVAVLWIDPATTASVRPVPLDCADESTPRSKPPFADGQKVVAIGAPLRGQKDVSFGAVVRVEPHASVADFRLAPGSTGGPVFSTGGVVVGLSSVVDDPDERRSRDARIVPVDDACEVVRSAEKAMPTAQRPVATRLPVEPLRPFPADALEAAVQRRAGNLSPAQMSSSDFDIAFLTPVVVYGAQHNTQQANPRAGLGSTRGPNVQQGRQVSSTDFGDWSDYFADVPPVLVVRVTPKLAESFWTTVARGAAYTQGVVLPPIKHFKPGFSRLQALCGAVEVTPIHPFTLEQRVSETDAIREGLYVFDPQALGPHCKSVKLVLYSEKNPEKPDARAVDPQVIERIWQDFAPYRALGAASSDGRP
jgi:S1-C subfamily serine protease